MKIEKTPKGTSMYKQGWKAIVVWNDKSKTYYRTKRDALKEVRKESGRMGLGKTKFLFSNKKKVGSVLLVNPFRGTKKKVGNVFQLKF